FQKPLNYLRQTALAVKDLGGLAITAIDLPRQIISDYRSSIQDSLSIMENSFKIGPGGRQMGGGVMTGVSASAIPTKATSLEDRAKSAFDSINDLKAKHEGLSSNYVSQGQLGTTMQQLQEVDPLNEVFNN